ncbi:hypothetical protein ISN44_As07g005550 [Arabidopsis suecica]|uniref:Uncharacterized protein n=1 Tax=Arabidopsis suecica TaxID=45249 RepID=A0A8T2BMY4_ARASU|nr:hypothetical protein ISN44_As07g005550 [Arabidopsis suecica]
MIHQPGFRSCLLINQGYRDTSLDPLQKRGSKETNRRQSHSGHTALIHQPGLRACLLRNQGNRGTSL